MSPDMYISQSNLPPGFRFHPTDEELILHYLKKKITSSPLPVSIIAEVNIYKFDPWDLPTITTFGEKEWYFFTPRDRKYPNGARPNRAAASGYWKATGTDKTIVASLATTRGGQQNVVGVKKALVFYKGRPPKGTKTNWIMHEYRLLETFSNNNNNKSSMRLDDWVLCRIYKKSHVFAPPPPSPTPATTSSKPSYQERDQEEEEKLFEKSINLPNPATQNMMNGTLHPPKSSSFSNLLDVMDYSFFNSFLSENTTDMNPSEFEFNQPFFNSCNNDNNNNC